MPPLPLPQHFDPVKVSQVWRVPYQERAAQAQAWAKEHLLQPAAQDDFKIGLVIIDAQNTFCLPDFELYVAGRSGTGAVDDSRKLCEFIYRNLGQITQIIPTLDTHYALQIFHAAFLVNEAGEHPPTMTMVSAADIKSGAWRFNPDLAKTLGIDAKYGQAHLQHYVQSLQDREKYLLTIWPYHAMLGGIGHALVPSIEEAIFFHSTGRSSLTDFQIKGQNPLTENYSAIGPEITKDVDGNAIDQPNRRILEKLIAMDALFIAGQAKSHCVAWTISDLLDQIIEVDPSLAEKVYLLEDCTSPVVIPGVVDFTDDADEAFDKFKASGMHLVKSTDSLDAILKK